MEPNLDLSGVTLAGSEDTITLAGTTRYSQPSYNFANVTVNNGGAVTGTNGYGYPNVMPNITISSGTGYSSPIWSTTASPWLGNGISTEPGGSGKLKLDGENADIEVNGESLMSLMKEIRERLNLITINEKMEKEWNELRALGEQYRALEAKLKEQGEMWAKLKAMPAPDIG